MLVLNFRHHPVSHRISTFALPSTLEGFVLETLIREANRRLILPL